MRAKNLVFIGVLPCLLAILNSCSSTKFALKAGEKARLSKPFDAIIVPGLPYDDSTSSLNVVMSARMLWSKKLFEDGVTKNIIYSGAAVSTPYYEGIAMKTIADSMGIPSDHTFAEVRAEHSTENIWYSYLLAKKLGFSKLALATDPFQTKMLKRFLVKRVANMSYIPIVFKELDPSHSKVLIIPKINPKAAYKNDFVALKSRESFLLGKKH